MSKKILIFIIIILVIVITILALFLFRKNQTTQYWFPKVIPFEQSVKPNIYDITCGQTDPLFCETDNDCTCVQDAGCFMGNKNYYFKCEEKGGFCFDLCTGWGQKPLKCIDNKCSSYYQ